MFQKIKIPILGLLLNVVSIGNRITLNHKRKIHYFVIGIFILGIVFLFKINSGISSILIYIVCFTFVELMLIQTNITEAVVAGMFIAENAAHYLTMSGFYLPKKTNEVDLRDRTEINIYKNLDYIRALMRICSRPLAETSDGLLSDIRVYFMYQCHENSELKMFSQIGFDSPVQNNFSIYLNERNILTTTFIEGNRKILYNFSQDISSIHLPYSSPNQSNYHKIKFLMLFPFNIERQNSPKNKGMIVIECDKTVVVGILKDILPSFHKLSHFIAAYWACSCCCPLTEQDEREVYCG